MIEINHHDCGWKQLDNGRVSEITSFGGYRHSFSFSGYVVRVSGVVYTEWTEEFRDAVAKEVFWAKLQQETIDEKV